MIDFTITNYPPRDSINILLVNLEMSPTTNSNYWALVISKQFSGHIPKVTKKLSSSMFLLSRLACYQNIESLLNAYYGCFHPYLSFGVLIWGYECSNIVLNTYFDSRKEHSELFFVSVRACHVEDWKNWLPPIYILECHNFLMKIISWSNLTLHILFL